MFLILEKLKMCNAPTVRVYGARHWDKCSNPKPFKHDFYMLKVTVYMHLLPLPCKAYNSLKCPLCFSRYSCNDRPYRMLHQVIFDCESVLKKDETNNRNGMNK